jgi:hypothetical protein
MKGKSVLEECSATFVDGIAGRPFEWAGRASKIKGLWLFAMTLFRLESVAPNGVFWRDCFMPHLPMD